ncbi:hypothetical protein KL919_004524 [Ogataea angusta]|nr:hypothetical protein KL919_004524 [Ogataea angusta]
MQEYVLAGIDSMEKMNEWFDRFDEQVAYPNEGNIKYDVGSDGVVVVIVKTQEVRSQTDALREHATKVQHSTEKPASPGPAAVLPPGAAVPDPGRAHRAGVWVGAVSAQIGAIELHPGRLLLPGVVPVLAEIAVVAHCRLVLPEKTRPQTLVDRPRPDDLRTHAAVPGNSDRLPHAQHAEKPLHPHIHLFLPHPALRDAGHRRGRLGPHDFVQGRAELRVHGADDRPQHGLFPQFHRFPRIQLCRLC